MIASVLVRLAVMTNNKPVQIKMLILFMLVICYIIPLSDS